MKGQGAVARIDAVAAANEIMNRLELVVSIYGIDGQNIYNRKFDLIWRQIAR